MEPTRKRIIVHTDGGCRPNPGVGAWAAILRYGDKEKELVGGEDESTNNRMELTAALMALEALKEPCEVELHTDSQYLKNGITQWIKGWKARGWQRKEGSRLKPVLNADLWQRLDAAVARHKIHWCWVEGHAGVAANERCDQLCTAEIERRWRERNARSAK
jgi:ribonuclease HI